VLEHAEDTGFLVGHVGRDGDVGEVTNGIHAVGVFEIRKFIDTGATPGGPEIDECHFARGVGAEGFEIGGGNERNIDRLGIEFAEGRHAVGLFFSPFRGAAEDAGVRDGWVFVGEKRVDGIAGIIGFDQFGAITVVDAAFV